jgi:hypothetical protein
MLMLISNKDYMVQNLDAFVGSNAEIDEATITSGGNICSITAIDTLNSSFVFKALSGDKKTILRAVHSSQIIAATVWRVHCEKVLQNTVVTVAFALRNITFPRNEKPQWAEVSVYGEAGRALRPFYLDPIQQCFVEDKIKCSYQLLPNDYRATFDYFVLSHFFYGDEYDPKCPNNQCPGWGAEYGPFDFSDVPGSPRGQHLESPR